jgi:hypothetical protein
MKERTPSATTLTSPRKEKINQFVISQVTNASSHKQTLATPEDKTKDIRNEPATQEIIRAENPSMQHEVTGRTENHNDYTESNIHSNIPILKAQIDNDSETMEIELNEGQSKTSYQEAGASSHLGSSLSSN